MHPNSGNIVPRLLNAEQAARYLGYETTGLLAHLPVKPIRMVESGPGCQPKYDRRGLDAWLDELSGLSVSAVQSGAQTDAETQYADWKATRAIH